MLFGLRVNYGDMFQGRYPFEKKCPKANDSWNRSVLSSKSVSNTVSFHLCDILNYALLFLVRKKPNGNNVQFLTSTVNFFESRNIIFSPLKDDSLIERTMYFSRFYRFFQLSRILVAIYFWRINGLIYRYINGLMRK